MLRFFPTALLFVVIIVYFNRVVSIRCYVCRSEELKECTENLNYSLVHECPQRPSATGQYCRKILQQLYFKNEKKITTIRECAYEKNPKQCYKTSWVLAAYQEICECDGDMCNRSSKGFDFDFGMLTSIFSVVLTFKIIPIWMR